MLYPLYALKEKGYTAEYEEKLFRSAFREFISVLPNGVDDYLDALRRMYSSLYNQVLEGKSESSFLDKTPRYYLILDELASVFPDAKFILLRRNPLSVLSSLLEWRRSDVKSLHRHKLDLLDCPRRMNEFVTSYESNCVEIAYEELIDNPDREIGRLCQDLGLRDVSGLKNYDKNESYKFGDKKSVGKYDNPVKDFKDSWMKEAKSDSLKCALFLGYLNMLGEETIAQMGYEMGGHKQYLVEVSRSFENMPPIELFDQYLFKKGGNDIANVRKRNKFIDFMSRIFHRLSQ